MNNCVFCFIKAFRGCRTIFSMCKRRVIAFILLDHVTLNMLGQHFRVKWYSHKFKTAQRYFEVVFYSHRGLRLGSNQICCEKSKGRTIRRVNEREPSQGAFWIPCWESKTTDCWMIGVCLSLARFRTCSLPFRTFCGEQASWTRWDRGVRCSVVLVCYKTPCSWSKGKVSYVMSMNRVRSGENMLWDNKVMASFHKTKNESMQMAR